MAKQKKFHDRLQLSGNAYISVRLRIEGDWGRVVIKKPRNCDHVESVCIGGDYPGDCAKSWLQDYVFLYERTNGGRRFRIDVRNAAHEYAIERMEADRDGTRTAESTVQSS